MDWVIVNAPEVNEHAHGDQAYRFSADPFQGKMGIKVNNVHIQRFIWLITRFVEQCSEYFWVLDRFL
jgi:hypothetical protein